MKTFQTYSITGLVPIPVNYFFVFTPLKGLSHEMDCFLMTYRIWLENMLDPDPH
jgi:hypothetical protein